MHAAADLGPPGTDKIVGHLRGIYEWDIETRLDALPPGGHEIVCDEFGQDGTIYDKFDEGDVRITAFKVLHCEPQNTFAMKVEYRDRTFVFSADTKKCDSMLHHAAGCDLLVHEAFPPANSTQKIEPTAGSREENIGSLSPPRARREKSSAATKRGWP